VSFELRYRVLLAARSRAALSPAVAWLFVLAGVYAYKPNEVRGSLGVTALLLVPITAWLAVSLSHAEPRPQRELIAAAQGRGPAEALVLAAAAIVSVPLFELDPALSPAAWTADALLNGGAIAGPAIALAVHAVAVVALAAVALERVA
jgi:hypothetical protein